MLRDEPGYLVDMPGSRWRDVGGQIFGKLTALEPLGEKRYGQHLWLCRCECGRYKTVAIGALHLGLGGTKSCGCLLGRQPVHGMTNTSIHSRWCSIHARCYNPRKVNFKSYGGRGITVCERWHDFTLFYQDMGEPPFDGAQIDRIDSDLGYSPENCRWLSASENSSRSSEVRRARKLLAEVKVPS